MRLATTAITVLLLLTAGLPAQEAGGQESFQAKYFENAKVVRVKYVEGEAFVDRSYDEGQEEATVNLPLFEKDMVETTDGRMEIYLGRLNYLRMDYDTRISLEKLPALRHTALTMNIQHGGIYLDVNSLDYERDMEIQTPDCGVFLLGHGVLRINVTPDKGTEIQVREGLVEVAGTNYSRDIRSGQKVVFLDGQVRERPYYFRASLSDDFDQWQRNRDQQLGTARYSTSRYLEEGYSDYEYELSRYGRWQFSRTYNANIWIPFRLMDGWRPYFHGRWVWNPYYGYVWTSYDPWGWFTHHYGRWQWDGSLGWYWIPGYRWSPAWVAWYWGDSYYGWTPLSYWNRPVFVFNRHWDRHYRYWKGLPRNSMSTVIIRKDRLLVSRIDRFAANRPGARFDVRHTIPFKGNAPSLQPKWKTLHLINAKGRNVIVKSGALTSTGRYRTLRDGLLTRKTPVTQTRVIHRYSSEASASGGKTIRNYGTRTVTRRQVGSRSSESPGTVPETHRYRSTTKTTTGGRTTVRRRTTTTRTTTTRTRATGKTTTTTKKAKSTKSGGTKKAKRKEDSPAYSPTAHSRAPSGSAGYTTAPSSRSGESFRTRATGFPPSTAGHYVSRRTGEIPRRYLPPARDYSSIRYTPFTPNLSGYLNPRSSTPYRTDSSTAAARTFRSRSGFVSANTAAGSRSHVTVRSPLRSGASSRSSATYHSHSSRSSSGKSGGSRARRR